MNRVFYLFFCIMILEISLMFIDLMSFLVFCWFDDEILVVSYLEVINGNGRCENKDSIVLF